MPLSKMGFHNMPNEMIMIISICGAKKQYYDLPLAGIVHGMENTVYTHI